MYVCMRVHSCMMNECVYVCMYVLVVRVLARADFFIGPLWCIRFGTYLHVARVAGQSHPSITDDASRDCNANGLGERVCVEHLNAGGS